jgi:hypothetical protein
MENNNRASNIITALQANRDYQVDWLLQCQIVFPGHQADGAIKKRPNQDWIIPYFSNFAAMALLQEPSAYQPVRQYLDWYLRHLEDDGTILDCRYDAKLNRQTKTPDSEDAYAGTYLSLAALYQKRTGDTRWVRDNLPGLKKTARVIIHLMDHDGLTYARSGHKVKYLMDNCEACKGLLDFAGLLQNLGDGDAAYFKDYARKIAGGIERNLWNPFARCYHPAKTGWFNTGLNLSKFYPDAACQIFPVLHGLLKPGSGKGTRLYRMLNESHPGWVGFQPPHFPWTVLGYCAGLYGDYRRAYEKIRLDRENYIETGSGNWFCAEAAFFILTCTVLIDRRDQWFKM